MFSMSGIVGTDATSDASAIEEALTAIHHRGHSGTRIVETESATLGQVWTEAQDHVMEGEAEATVVLDGEVHNWYDLSPGAVSPLEAIHQAYQEDGPGFVRRLDGHFAVALASPDGLFLARDRLGVVPLYYADNGCLAFASELKALYHADGEVVELPPGHYHDPHEGLTRYTDLEPQEPRDGSPDELATELRHTLVAAIAKRVSNGHTGSWLSGGLDSSVIAALARRQTSELHTFAVGLKGAPDLLYARMVADFIEAQHHELECAPEDLVRVLPEVIYHLESFDALLVRSSVTNYMVAKLASDHVAAAFSGEGGDELFAGYEYLKDLDPSQLPDELIDITGRLHNTALQRVDRCSKAHGLIAHVPFLDQDVVSFALTIPSRYKLNRKAGMVEKWILRQAAEGLLPAEVADRPKAKFWEGAGVSEILSDQAQQTVSDADFAAERKLPDGSVLNTKEELVYYRLFREHFGELSGTSLVGRTKGAPSEA
jgi:asparagine synthase (glutamine-hydrolysing)